MKPILVNKLKRAHFLSRGEIEEDLLTVLLVILLGVLRYLFLGWLLLFPCISGLCIYTLVRCLSILTLSDICTHEAFATVRKQPTYGDVERSYCATSVTVRTRFGPVGLVMPSDACQSHTRKTPIRRRENTLGCFWQP